MDSGKQAFMSCALRHFYPRQRGWVYHLASEAPLFGGVPTEPETFLETQGVSGLGPLRPDPHDKALRHNHPVGLYLLCLRIATLSHPTRGGGVG